MALTVLSVAYPFAPVGPDAVGGAEQVLAQIDAALVRAGGRSIVVACEGSHPTGTLLPVSRPDGMLTEQRMAAGRARHARRIIEALERWPVDIVHLHGVDFHSYLPPARVPVLATLHLPLHCYAPEALHPSRPDTWLNCVSRAQHASCATNPNPRLCQPIENGVSLDVFQHRRAKRRFALMLSRICPEKGVHLAIAAAKAAGIPLLIAGQVFPYRDHQRYFREEIAPRLDRWRRFIGPIDLRRKRRLLATARCLLVPSLVPETSSLAAREALASGTPVIAFARGALLDTIEPQRTGFLVEDEIEMAAAIGRIGEIDSELCRCTARARFCAQSMVERYFALYESVAGWRRATGPQPQKHPTAGNGTDRDGLMCVDHTRSESHQWPALLSSCSIR